MLKLLIQDTGGLADNIKALEDIKGHGEGGGYGPEDGRPLPQAERRAQHGVGGMVAEAPPARERCGRGFQPLHGQGAVVHRHLPEHHAPAWVRGAGLFRAGYRRRGVECRHGAFKLGILGLFNPIKKLVNLFKKTGGIILKLKGPLMAIGGWAKGGLGTLLNLFGKLFGPAGRLAFLFAQLRLRLSPGCQPDHAKRGGCLYQARLAAAHGSAGLLAMSAALLANPVFWIVAGVIVLIAAVAGLIIYWDELKAAFGDTWWGASDHPDRTRHLQLVGSPDESLFRAGAGPASLSNSSTP